MTLNDTNTSLYQQEIPETIRINQYEPTRTFVTDNAATQFSKLRVAIRR
jgi:hypothetical protein